MGKKIILDCDPGHDDAVAILLALGNPAIDLLGVTTVGGNQSLDKVTYNARAVLEKAHATDVPVHMGCGRPLIREPEAAATIHGQSGLDGVQVVGTASNCLCRAVRSTKGTRSTGSSIRSCPIRRRPSRLCRPGR